MSVTTTTAVTARSRRRPRAAKRSSCRTEPPGKRRGRLAAAPARLTRLLPPERRVFTVDTAPGSLSFYVAEPVQRLTTLAEAAARLGEVEPTAIVTKSKRLAELGSLLAAPAYVWWESPRVKLLVVNRPPPGRKASSFETWSQTSKRRMQREARRTRAARHTAVEPSSRPGFRSSYQRPVERRRRAPRPIVALEASS